MDRLADAQSYEHIHTHRGKTLWESRVERARGCKCGAKGGERREKGIERERAGEKERERDLSERGLIFLWLYTCKLKQFPPSEGQGPLSSFPVPTV